MQIVSIQLAVSLFHGCVRMVEVVSCVRGALTCARSHGSASCAPRSWSLGWQASTRDRGAFLGQGAGCNMLYFQQYSSEKQQVGLHKNDCLCVLPGVRVSSCACVFQGARRRRNRGVDTPAISDTYTLCEVDSITYANKRKHMQLILYSVYVFELSLAVLIISKWSCIILNYG